MKRALQRRIEAVAKKVHAPAPGMCILFQETDETDEQVRARFRAMIASGEASENERLVKFRWLPLAAEKADN
jgi:hypothetical protein